MIVRGWFVTLICLVLPGWLPADTKSSTSKGDPRAAELLHQASQTRYTWSPEISAVSGKLTWEVDGKAGSGSFRSVLHQRGGFTINPQGDAQVPAEVKDHVASMIGHRVAPKPGTPQRAQPDYVIIVEDEDRGPLIQMLGDAMHSTQRVKEGKLVQVNRLMGDKRFTIDVTEFEKAPDSTRFYPAAFTVTWWDATSGKLVEKQHYTTQGFQTVDGQMFPKAEKVVSDKGGKTSTLVITYSDVKFDLPKAVPAEK
jgi:hypothetical protein